MKTLIQNGILEAVINHKGAELSSLKKKDGTDLIWEIDSKFWNKTSPVLFPIVGALKNGKYFFEGKEYHLPRHGFTRDHIFEVVEQKANRVTFSLKSSEETLNVYPFEFELRISYFLDEVTLTVRYEVFNLSDNEMYYSIGAHPAFSIKGNFTDYSLQFDKNETLVSYELDKDIFSGKTRKIELKENILPLQYQLFENDAIVLKEYTTNCLTLLYHNQPYIKIDFEDFPYLGIWTKKDAPFLCIEPWLGIADSIQTSGKLEEKEGIQKLSPNGKSSAEWKVEVF